MTQYKNFRKKKGKVKSKKYSVTIRTFDKRILTPLSPYINIKRSNNLSKNKKESVKHFSKYHSILRVKFRWIIAIILKYKLKRNKFLQRIRYKTKDK